MSRWHMVELARFIPALSRSLVHHSATGQLRMLASAYSLNRLWLIHSSHLQPAEGQAPRTLHSAGQIPAGQSRAENRSTAQFSTA